MSVIPNATGPVLRQFLVDNIVEGSTVVTDGFKSYWPATKGRYIHELEVAPGVAGPAVLARALTAWRHWSSDGCSGPTTPQSTMPTRSCT